MNLYCKIGVCVSKTDNGWVLEWKNETVEHPGLHDLVQRDPHTRGIEVFTDKAALLKRLERLIS